MLDWSNMLPLDFSVKHLYALGIMNPRSFLDTSASLFNSTSCFICQA